MQAYLRVLASVAVVFGLQGVAKGVAGVRGAAPDLDGTRVGVRSVDSELRFFAAWYALAGVLLFRAAKRPESETVTVRGVSVAVWLAAVGRLLSIRSLGRPHPLFVALLGVELVVPAIALPWQARVARAR